MGKRGPAKRFHHIIEVHVDEEMNDFITGLAAVMDTSKAAVLRALAQAHINYVGGLARQYVESGMDLVEAEANR